MDYYSNMKMLQSKVYKMLYCRSGMEQNKINVSIIVLIKRRSKNQFQFGLNQLQNSD